VFTPPSLAVRSGERKLVRYGSPDGIRHELYDLAADPREQTNLFDAAPGAAEPLLSLLEAHDRERARAGAATAPDAFPALDPDREAKLRALGYVE
jgi:hypothetical protein